MSLCFNLGECRVRLAQKQTQASRQEIEHERSERTELTGAVQDIVAVGRQMLAAAAMRRLAATSK